MNTVRFRVSAWYRDEEIELPVPDGWEVDHRRPPTPPPLTPGELQAAVRSPVGQPPLHELAAGRRRPVIIVDDLTRPTPAEAVLPYLLAELELGGIPASAS